MCNCKDCGKRLGENYVNCSQCNALLCDGCDVRDYEVHEEPCCHDCKVIKGWNKED